MHGSTVCNSTNIYDPPSTDDSTNTYDSTINPLKILLIVVSGIDKVAPMTQYSYHHFARIQDSANYTEECSSRKLNNNKRRQTRHLSTMNAESANYRQTETGLRLGTREKPFMTEVFTSTSKRYAILADKFIREADGILLAYSVTNKNALRQVTDQYDKIERARTVGYMRQNGCQCHRVPPMPLLLVGIDSGSNVPRMVSKPQGANLALRLGIEFMEMNETWNSPIEILFYPIVRVIDTYTREGKGSDEFSRCPGTQRSGARAAFSRRMKSDLDKIKASIRPCIRKSREADIKNLRNAIVNDQQETVRSLVQSGVDVNGFDQSGSTLLHVAAALNRVEIAKLLLQSGASVNQISPLNGTALTVAASRGNDEIVQLLLGYGARVDDPCDYYENMLQTVARRDNPNILRQLNKRMSWNPFKTRKYSWC
ncbi:unnamed protein product [Clonostachys rhizophaga]|uniref:Uncharacterized protein n=1 Tax=Clonostachys rhizophaga TaxID=160324 RepID=A0A9N9VCA9_9HYPO|nr:unnamed protein product [Clonostachys rhizophaga]